MKKIKSNSLRLSKRALDRRLTHARIEGRHFGIGLTLLHLIEETTSQENYLVLSNVFSKIIEGLYLEDELDGVINEIIFDDYSGLEYLDKLILALKHTNFSLTEILNHLERRTEICKLDLEIWKRCDENEKQQKRKDEMFNAYDKEIQKYIKS